MRDRVPLPLLVLAALLALLPAWALRAQDKVTLTIGGQDVGLSGVVRSGSWAPLQVLVSFSGSRPRNAAVEWIMPDADGDEVHVRREFVLNIGPNPLWLYAVPPLNSGRGNWRVRVVDKESGEVLAHASVTPLRALPATWRLVGEVGVAPLALKPYEHTYTNHEPTAVLTGLLPASLPDRWYGLAMLQVLVWTPEAGYEPDGRIQDDTYRAVREWVQRGGHLVIILPARGDPWDFERRGMPLSSLLPPVRAVSDQIAGPPWWAAEPVATALSRTRFEIKRFELLGEAPTTDAALAAPPKLAPDAPKDVSFLLRDADPSQPKPGSPNLVATAQYGLGRVTVIGFDITDRRLIESSPRHDKNVTLWRGPPQRGEGAPQAVGLGVLGWEAPADEPLRPDEADALYHNKKIAGPDRSADELGDLIGRLIAMTGTASTALLVAILLFAVYWLLAGPLGFAILRQYHLVRHSWLAFAGVVLAFSAISWAGALLLRPAEARIAHLTVLDLDSSTGLAHAHSWLAMFVPKHGAAEVAVAPGEWRSGGEDHTAAAGNTIWSPGVETAFGAGSEAYPDTQQYALDAVSPTRRPAPANGGPGGGPLIPMRATAKQFEVDYLGTAGTGAAGAPLWPAATGKLHAVATGFRLPWPDHWAAGELVHHLPAPLEKVSLVYCPGNGQTPWIRPYLKDAWKPGEPLKVPAQEAGWQQLVIPPAPPSPLDEDPKRTWLREGYLGPFVEKATGRRAQPGEDEPLRDMSDDKVYLKTQLLSFFSVLPMPDYYVHAKEVFGDPNRVNYTRAVGRQADLTALLPLHRVLVLGYLKGGPLPLPLKVDGRDVPTDPNNSWTMVRFIVPVE